MYTMWLENACCYLRTTLYACIPEMLSWLKYCKAIKNKLISTLVILGDWSIKVTTDIQDSTAQVLNRLA